MSDQQAPPPTPQSPPPPQAPPGQPAAAPSAMSTMMNSMNAWERFIVIGALILVLGDLVFGILLRDFYAGDVVWLASAIALIAFYANRRWPGRVPAYTTVMLLAAVVVGLVGLRDALIEVYYILRNISTLNDGAIYLLGFVVWLAGLALVVYGGWMLWRSRSAA
jgi:hypothetical protein